LTALCRLAVVAGLACVGIACGGGGPKLYPVRGKVLFENKPAEGATVVFHPVGGEAGSAKPAGTVAADGSSTLHTHPPCAGAPPGGCAVGIVWWRPSAGGLEIPKSLLPARYADWCRCRLSGTGKA